jgi:hypothetical protein
MQFKGWDDKQLSEYLSREVASHISGREARIAEFGPVFGAILNEGLGLLAVQELHRLLTCEAQDLFESAFRMHFRHLAPRSEQERAACYRKEVATKVAEENRVRGEQLQRQIDRTAAAEKARAEKATADAEKHHRDGIRANAEALAELEKTRERENAAFVESQSQSR